MNEGARSYSTIQLAQTLGVSVQTVQRWVDAGHIKAWKTVGGHRKIDADSADAWMRTMRLGNADMPAPTPVSPTGAALRVLVVDDDPASVEVVATLVADTIADAVIEKACNGFQALQTIARNVPDLLVTDIVMPHIDGLEMLRHVAAQESRPGLVVVTSVITREDVESSGGTLPVGIVFLRKPLDQEAFVELLRTRVARGSQAS